MARVFSLLLVLLLSSLIGCNPPPPPTGAAPAVSAPAPGETWEQQWEATVAAAKAEGEVIVYGSPEASLRRVLTEPFEQKYGIRVNYLAMAGSQAAPRVLAERDANIYAADMYIGGATSVYGAWLPANILEPVDDYLILPEVKDPKHWTDGHHYGDFDKKYVFIYNLEANYPFYINTDLVGPDEINGYQDLLNPKWKGKIGLADPRNPGPGNGQWMVMLESKSLGDAFLRQLAAQGLFITLDRRTLTERVARGALAIAMGGLDSEVQELRQRGLPIQNLHRFPREGTTLTPAGGAIVVFKNLPHPNATRVYLNWFLSRETMETHCGVQVQPCLRADMKRSPEAGPSLDLLLAQGVTFIDNYTQASVDAIERARAHARSVIRD